MLFCKQAALELNRLIPYDSVCVFLLNDQFQIGEHHVIGMADKDVKDFVDYYVTIDPCKQRTPPNANSLFHTVLYYLRQILKKNEAPDLIVYRELHV